MPLQPRWLTFRPPGDGSYEVRFYDQPIGSVKREADGWWQAYRLDGTVVTAKRRRRDAADALRWDGEE